MSLNYSESGISNKRDSDCEDKFSRILSLSKLKPYSFEPLISSDEDEGIDNVGVENYKEIEALPSGNIGWCLRKQCKPMD